MVKTLGISDFNSDEAKTFLNGVEFLIAKHPKIKNDPRVSILIGQARRIILDSSEYETGGYEKWKRVNEDWFMSIPAYRKEKLQ